MSDDRDFIERTISLNELTMGVKPTPETLANALLLRGPHARGAILEQLKADAQNREFTAKQSADRLSYERALWDAHRKALAVGK